MSSPYIPTKTIRKINTERSPPSIPSPTTASVVIKRENRILFTRFCELIEKNFHKSISAKEIADDLGCTYEHLCRVVKKCSDKTVNNLIGECRIKRIMSLCADTELSAEDIASRLDFGSAELMRKYFKYHSGEALSDYRRRIKNAL